MSACMSSFRTLGNLAFNTNSINLVIKSVCLSPHLFRSVAPDKFPSPQFLTNRWPWLKRKICNFRPSSVLCCVSCRPQGCVQGLVAGMTVHADELEIVDVAIRVLSNLVCNACRRCWTFLKR